MRIEPWNKTDSTWNENHRESSHLTDFKKKGPYTQNQTKSDDSRLKKRANRKDHISLQTVLSFLPLWIW